MSYPAGARETPGRDHAHVNAPPRCRSPQVIGLPCITVKGKHPETASSLEKGVFESPNARSLFRNTGPRSGRNLDLRMPADCAKRVIPLRLVQAGRPNVSGLGDGRFGIGSRAFSRPVDKPARRPAEADPCPRSSSADLVDNLNPAQAWPSGG